MRTPAIFATLTAALLTISAIAQGAALELGPIVRISAAGEDINQVWGSTEPEDSAHLMVCGYFSDPERNVVYGYVYTSIDRGTSWHRTLVDDSTRWVTEESCTFGEHGHAYFAAGESDTSTGRPRHEWGHMQLFVSEDHGLSWHRGARRGFVDWTYLAALPSNAHHSASLTIFGNMATDKRGHWWPKAPVAFNTDENARVLSSPVAPKLSTLIGTFSGGSVVLPDRTALFIAGSQRRTAKAPAGEQTPLQIFAYSSSPPALKVRARLRTLRKGYFYTEPALVRARDEGRFPGRLYAGWAESALFGAWDLWLATSDDEGFHWSSRRIALSKSSARGICPNTSNIRLAVTREGTLGVLWMPDSGTLLFTSSIDGGNTFRASQSIAHAGLGPLAITDAVPFNEWWAAEVQAMAEGKPVWNFADMAHLGISVRMARVQGVSDFALVTDGQEDFRALWAQVGLDGVHVLSTRRIRLQMGDDSGESELRSATESIPCAEGEILQHASNPTPTPVLKLQGRRDLTGLFNLQIDRLRYDATSKSVTVNVVLLNKSANVIRRDLSLLGLGVHSDYGNVEAVNASGVEEGHLFWQVSDALPPGGLAPHASSAPIELRFKLSGGPSAPLFNGGDAVAMSVRLLSKAH